MLNLAARAPAPEGFHIGDIFKIRGEEYVLTSVHPRSNEARLRPRLGGNDITLNADELVSWAQSSSITHTQSVSDETRHAVKLATLNEREKFEWERRCEYIKELLQYETPKTRDLVARNIYETFSRRQRRLKKKEFFQTETMPSMSAVYEWIAIVKANSGFLAAVAYKDHRSKPRKSRLDPVVLEIVEECLDKQQAEEKISLTLIYSVLNRRIKELNSQRKPGEPIYKMPSKQALQNRLKARNPMDKDRAEKGDRYVAANYNYGGKTQYGKYIGSRVEGDTNYLDCLVYDPILDITYRPLLLAMIDSYTKAVVGYEVSYLQRGSEKLARAMTNMMSENDMASYSCVPSMVVVDNGKEFDNLTLKHIQDRAQIVFCFSPPYSPNCKAHIERLWATLNVKLIHGMKGTTKENIFKRGYYESEELAVFTIEEIRERIDEVINEYHHATHSRELLSPKTMWENAAAERPPRVYSRDTCITLGTRHVERKVRNGKVEVENLTWRGAALPENFNEQYVKVCINESDLTNVWVINPDDPDDVYKLDPVDPNLQTGLSLEFWKSYRKHLKAYEESTGHPDIAMDLRADIAEKIIKESQEAKGQTKRKRARAANAAAVQLENMTQELRSNVSAETPLRLSAPKEDKPKFNYRIED